MGRSATRVALRCLRSLLQCHFSATKSQVCLISPLSTSPPLDYGISKISNLLRCPRPLAVSSTVGFNSVVSMVLSCCLDHHGIFNLSSTVSTFLLSGSFPPSLPSTPPQSPMASNLFLNGQESNILILSDRRNPSFSSSSLCKSPLFLFYPYVRAFWNLDFNLLYNFHCLFYKKA